MCAIAMIGRASIHVEPCGADALTSVAVAAGLQIISVIQITMDEDNALGLAIFICLGLCCISIFWTSWRQQRDGDDFLPLADTV